MKNEAIRLNSTVSIDLPKLISGKLLVQANSGGGKSWLIRRIVERAYGKIQIIILDPEGELSTLREKFDFVLAGKGGDTPAEPRSAALLATRLLELKVSTIIDLYELHPQERKHFVRLFLESMVNVPKSLYHPTLVILDEAHTFAPEKGEAESLSAVVGMASLGRKREFSLILATQRISKLHKDAAAECNNKLIGRASLDIDRKRAADELGITDKEKILALRSLEPGEFFAFGPAISNEVIKIKVGEVSTSIPKGGAEYKVVPPTERVKKLLGKLADLPAEAQKEAQTVAEMKAEIRKLRQHKCAPVGNLQKELEPHLIAIATERKATHQWVEQWREFVGYIHAHTRLDLLKVIKDLDEKMKNKPSNKPAGSYIGKLPGNSNIVKSEPIRPLPVQKEPKMDGEENRSEVGICAKKIYSFLHENSGKSFTKVQLGAVTGYSPKSGGFNNAIARLNALGLIRKNRELIEMGQLDTEHIIEGEEFSPEPRFWERKLGKCEIEIYKWLWERQGEVHTKETIGEETHYSSTSGGFNNAVSHLNAIGLIRRQDGGLTVNPELLNL